MVGDGDELVGIHDVGWDDVVGESGLVGGF